MPGSTSRRGYGWVYQQARRRILGPSGGGLLAKDPPCHWQGPNCTGVATTADHDPPIREVGHPHLSLVPACKACNLGWRRERRSSDPSRVW